MCVEQPLSMPGLLKTFWLMCYCVLLKIDSVKYLQHSSKVQTVAFKLPQPYFHVIVLMLYSITIAYIKQKKSHFLFDIYVFLCIDATIHKRWQIMCLPYVEYFLLQMHIIIKTSWEVFKLDNISNSHSTRSLQSIGKHGFQGGLIHRTTDRKQTDIATYRLNWPRWKETFMLFLRLWINSKSKKFNKILFFLSSYLLGCGSTW